MNMKANIFIIGLMLLAPVCSRPLLAVEWESFPSGEHVKFANGGDVTAKLEDLGIPLEAKYPNSGKGANGLCSYPRNVWSLKAFDGRLYIGSGNSSNGGPYPNAFNAAVYCFDPATTNFVNEGDIMECQLDVFRVFSDGKLYIPSHDPSYGSPSNPLCGYYLRGSGANSTWTRASKFDNDVHNYDMAEFDGCLFACGYKMWWSSDGGSSYTIRGGGEERTTALFRFANVLYGVGVAQGERKKWAYIYNEETGKTEYGSYTAKPDVSLFVRKAGNAQISCEHLSEQNELIFPGVTDFGVSGFKATRPVSYKNRVVYIGGRVHNDHQIAPVAAFVAVPPKNVPDGEYHPFKARRIDLPEGAKPWSTMVADDKVYILWSTKDGEKTVNHLSVSTNALDFSEILSFKANTFARSVEYLGGCLYFGLGTEVADDGYFEGQTLVIEYSASELSADSGRILRCLFDLASLTVTSVPSSEAGGSNTDKGGSGSDERDSGTDAPAVVDPTKGDDVATETYVWSGALNSQNWGIKNNWVDGKVPPTGVACDVLIPNAANRAPIIPEGTSFNSLGIYKDMAFTYSVKVLKDLAISNATVEVNAPIEVGGDLTLEEGAVLTHVKGNKDKKEVHVCEVTVGGNFNVKSGAKVDVSGRGYVNTWSEPEYVANASGVYGGVGGVGGGGPVGTCYGSIFAPTNYGGSGTGSMTVNAGGAFVLKATGTVTLNGPILADADQTPQFRWGGAGGSVYIRAGRLVGNGSISANGMPCKLSYTYTGGGGRISLVLTEVGADFAQYVGTVTAYGGHKDGTTMRCGGAGTIYRQKGDEKDGEGTVYLSNATGWTMSQYDYDLTGFGYPGMDDLSKATVVLGPNSGLYLYSDCRIGKLVFADDVTVAYPASVNFNGYTLTVNEPRPAVSEWTDPAKYKFANVYNGTIARKGVSNLQWMKIGFVLFLQ